MTCKRTQEALDFGFEPVPNSYWFLKHKDSGMIFVNGNCENQYILCGGSIGNLDVSFDSRVTLTKEDREQWRAKGFKVMSENGEIF